MGCHGQGRLKLDQQAKTATTPWGAELTFDEMKGARFVTLDKMEMTGHPMEGHPISGINSKLGKTGGEITCLTCHQPHHSQVSNLMPPDVSSDIDLCNKCHKE